ncbi:hypothetical protein SLS62_007117 [Diatrype stigma]|uniref:Protein kinase domain-containing protein n=1 Tax=Diatrype stigma TaxID=117547 RepID=A0AAN9ULT6_9PEZI
MASLSSTLGLRAASSALLDTATNHAPAYLCFHFIFAYAVLSSRPLKQWYGLDHNESPRYDLLKYGDAAVASGTITQAQLEMMRRAEAASANAVENYTFFVAAMSFATLAGLERDVINKAGLVYTIARVAYAAAYILIGHPLWCQVRGFTWWWVKKLGSGNNAETHHFREYRNGRYIRRLAVKIATNDDTARDIRNELSTLQNFESAWHVNSTVAPTGSIDEASLPQLVVAIEYCDNGTVQQLMQRLRRAGIQLPNRMLWAMFLCLGRYTPWEDVLDQVNIPALGRRVQVKLHPELRKDYIDKDLMDLLVRCQATNEQDRPLLEELQKTVEDAVARPASYYSNIPGIDPSKETDEAITGIIQNYVLNETSYFWPSDIPLPDAPDTPIALTPLNVPLPASPISPL